MLIERRNGLARLVMDEGKANAIGPAFLEELDEKLGELLGDPPGALVITGAGAHFSAGLDLVTLHEIRRVALDRFLADFERVFTELFLFPAPVVAAVNGNAIAGGYVLAALADHRVAARGDYRIGLNEVRLGVNLPSIALEAPRAALRPDVFARVVLGGELYEPEDALRLGLVDELVEATELERRAEERARALMESPRLGFARIKREVREPFARWAGERGKASRRAFRELWFSEEARRLRREKFNLD